MFVYGMEFLVSIHRKLRFTMVYYIEKIMTGNISKYLEMIDDVYYIRWIFVETFYMERGVLKVQNNNSREINPKYDHIN